MQDNVFSYVEGYASVFNVPDQTGDIVQKGAFRKSLLKQKRIPLLWQHMPSAVLGYVSELKEDDKGLWVKLAVCTQTFMGRDVSVLVKNGILTGLSIGFAVVKAGRLGKNRLLQEVILKEISIVTFPAHIDAQITTFDADD